jgi:hypothetical protein
MCVCVLIDVFLHQKAMETQLLDTINNRSRPSDASKAKIKRKS